MTFFLMLLVSATLTQNVERLYIDQDVTCTIEIHHAVPETPNVEGFFAALDASKFPSFTVVSKKAAGSTLTFCLEPKQTGCCIFAPGFIEFLPQKTPLLLPAMQADCVPTGISTLEFMPLLPLYPEKKIAITPENKLRLLAMQDPLLQMRVNRFKMAWRMFVGVLIAACVSLLSFWALVEYELVARTKRWLQPHKDPEKELVKAIHNHALSYSERWENLFLLAKYLLGKRTGSDFTSYSVEEMRRTFKENDGLEKFFDRLERVLYACDATTDEEVERALSALANF